MWTKCRHKPTLWLRIGALLVMGMTVSVSASDWPMFRRNLTHSGWTSDVGADLGVTQWSYSMQTPIGWDGGCLMFSSPVVVGMYVYFTGRDGNFYRLDLNDGDLMYKKKIGDGYPVTSTPAIFGGKAYMLGGENDRVLHCHDITTGDELKRPGFSGASVS